MSSWWPARWPGFDGERLLADTRRICDAQIAFWHGTRKASPPFARYVFLLNAVDDGYGGLEHRASTALICARRDLPRQGHKDASEGYNTLLGLISHEYFHTWNVKRLKPRELAQIDFARENYTPLLWFFEGFTSYYDDLLLRRAGLIDAARYLNLLAKTLNGDCDDTGATGAERRAVQLRCLGQVLPQRREHTQCDDQLLRQGLAGGAGARPDAAP